MKQVELPSGRKIEIEPGLFKESKELLQALTAEFLRIGINGTDEVGNLIKNVFCLALSSQAIETKLWVCLKRCTYQDLKITEATFEPIEAREDYIDILYEVAQENVRPFTKSLFAQFRAMSIALEGIRASSASRTNTI